MNPLAEPPQFLSAEAHELANSLLLEAESAQSSSSRNTSASPTVDRQTAAKGLPVNAGELARILACSPYIARELGSDPTLLSRVLDDRLKDNLGSHDYLPRTLMLLGDPEAEELPVEDELMCQLRALRQHEMVRIAWRDLSGLASTDETLSSLSDFADSCIEAGIQYSGLVLQKRFGIPRDSNGQQQHLIVLCMGKLGGRELNFSSDIDLILCYPSAGETDGRKSISNEEFFRKQAQLFFKLLNKTTGDGFVFRVDLRLRPFGDSGPLVMNFEGIEHYYLSQGREWERYAMVKARALCGLEQDRDSLLQLLKPFVYRRYLDYSVFESLRELKRKIAAQLEKKGGRTNVKTGFGGIREIEFIGQAFQLLRGGREPDLQVRQITTVLTLLGRQKLLPIGDVECLLTAYDFLRRTENRLQMIGDEQVHVLPRTETDRCRLWYAMGCADEDDFVRQLEGHRANVNRVFSELFRVDGLSDTETPADPAVLDEPADTELFHAADGKRAVSKEIEQWQQLWNQLSSREDALSDSTLDSMQGTPEDSKRRESISGNSIERGSSDLGSSDRGSSQSDSAEGDSAGSDSGNSENSMAEQNRLLLHSAGFENAPAVYDALQVFKASTFYANLTTVAQRRAEALVPFVLANSSQSGNPDATLFRLLDLLRTIAGRSVYLQILIERPTALKLLAELFSRSSWLAEFVMQHPIVIDEILDYRNIENPPTRESLQQEMIYTLKRLVDQDLDVKMDALRHFKMANVMRVAAAEVEGHLELTQVSDCLALIADFALQAVCDLARAEMSARHGQPQCKSGKRTRIPAFAIVAYGKLGSMELTYASDLDLVFLHDSEGESQESDGDRPLDNMVYFGRLAQKIVHFLSTLTPAGVLYEIDTRLRPNGQSGLLVSSLVAFEQYQQEKAWTWEHQALVRARVVVGDDALRAAFEQVRHSVLVQPRDLQSLATDVSSMRSRMHAELAADREGSFDLKHDRGGIADIEFMVQYTVLAHANEYPELLAGTDNLGILQLARELDLLSADDVEVLASAYLELRKRVHRCALLEQKAIVESNPELQLLRDQVIGRWQKLILR